MEKKKQDTNIDMVKMNKQNMEVVIFKLLSYLNDEQIKDFADWVDMAKAQE